MKQIIQISNSIFKEENEKTFQKRIERVKLCYFKHLIKEIVIFLSKIKITFCKIRQKYLH